MNDAPDHRVYRPQPGIDPATRRLALFATAIAVVLAVMVGGWSLSGRHAGSVPVFEPLPGPVKIKPVDPGGLKLNGADPPPTSDAGGGRETLAPGPEAPDPDRLRAQLQRAQPAPAAPLPTPVTPDAKPAPAAAAPAPAPATATAPPATTAPAPAAAVAPAAASGVQVQLAALDSHAAAETEWARLDRLSPALFADRSHLVVEAVRDGKTFYRLRTGGFHDIAAATEFCAKVKAVRTACTIASF